MQRVVLAAAVGGISCLDIPQELNTTANAPIFGGKTARRVFAGWLGVWRSQYRSNDGSVPEVDDAALPSALQGVKPKIVISKGGAAGGVVSEGMGYAIMIEGFKAHGGDKTALHNGLALVRAWLGMVQGPAGRPQPYAGGKGSASSATKLEVWPYGVSAIKGHGGAAAAGVPAWKYPLHLCTRGCTGSATDGDEDAALGMIYLSAALGHPADFLDMTMRTVVAFASADLGFPDLYRTLPDGTKVFVPKGGSQWGGLLPSKGKFYSEQSAGCYNPSYFAPGHYRTFRDFVSQHWKSSFDSYLPNHLDGKASSAKSLREAFDGAVIAGYNLLYHGSCETGIVSNWVGAQSECSSHDELSCAGVPWKDTPFVGSHGTCSASGTEWGAWGADASRTPWRIAMDYALYSHEAARATMYRTSGSLWTSNNFGSKAFLNRIAKQYKDKSQCDGGKRNCQGPHQWAPAWSDWSTKLTCSNVPKTAENWWAPFMSYPTFTAFVAPYDPISSTQSSNWMDSFASICHFSSSGEPIPIAPTAKVCLKEYFSLSQEVVSTMVMAGAARPLDVAPSLRRRRRRTGSQELQEPEDADEETQEELGDEALAEQPTLV